MVFGATGQVKCHLKLKHRLNLGLVPKFFGWSHPIWDLAKIKILLHRSQVTRGAKLIDLVQ